MIKLRYGNTNTYYVDGIALITDEGCFAGDLEPEQYIEVYGNESALKEDWDRIRALHPANVYFGHF